ncbi:hypothetical protein [Paraburkholderia sediminicola]|uniref:hypothetical protein n=1 Tax=Paraburkholderia sediminicola TaxID=458836 RepID=UPI0038B8CDB5
MAEVVNVRAPGAVFDLHLPDNLQEVFADGVTNVAIGYPNSRLTFHVVQAPKVTVGPIDPNLVEQRRAVIDMIIPTASLFDLVGNLSRDLPANKQTLSDGAKGYAARFETILNNLTT